MNLFHPFSARPSVIPAQREGGNPDFFSFPARCFRTSLLFLLCALSACSAPRRNLPAIHTYYAYDFSRAAASFAPQAAAEPNNQTILNYARLGLAALADGDLRTAQSALSADFDLLNTAGLNKDRTVSSVLFHEGVRIWKGEPFEQALLFHYTSLVFALQSDWENARAAAANAIFRLTDFGADQSPEKLAARAAKDDAFLAAGYTPVDTNFALAFIMQALASKLSGAPNADALFDDALKINPDLLPLVSTLRSSDFNTLLVVDLAKGPTKMSFGPDNALARFQPQGEPNPQLLVSVNNAPWLRPVPVCDVDQLARDHRWNNLEDIRLAKSIVGDILITGGILSTQIGAHNDNSDAQIAGLAAILAGILSKSGAHADTRYLELIPKSIVLVPLQLDAPADLKLQIDHDDSSRLLLPALAPGSASSPRVLYLRLLADTPGPPDFLTRANPRFGNDHTGLSVDRLPYILGGHDCSTPSPPVLAAYQSAGFLKNFSLHDLIELYHAENISIPAIGDPFPADPVLARHILDGGSTLHSPIPDSLGFKRLFYSSHTSYKPRSDLVRNLRDSIRVQLKSASRNSSPIPP